MVSRIDVAAACCGKLRTMRHLLTALALMLAVLASYAVGAGASDKGAQRGTPRTPVYVPNTIQRVTVPCGEVVYLMDIDWWHAPPDRHYRARLTLEGGPALLELQIEPDIRAFLNVPANAPYGDYTVDLHAPDLDEGLYHLRLGVRAGPCPADGSVPAITLYGYNVFTSP